MDGNFEKLFTNLLFATGSCLERDMLRNLKDVLKAEYSRIWELSNGGIRVHPTLPTSDDSVSGMGSVP